MEWLGSLSVNEPTIALIVGVMLAAGATCLALLISPARTKETDPLSGLFERANLDTQLKLVADREAHARQAMNVVCARFHAHQPARRAQKPESSLEALSNLARVMRASADPHREAPVVMSEDEIANAGQWEEVLLLAPPSPEQSEPAQAA